MRAFDFLRHTKRFERCGVGGWVGASTFPTHFVHKKWEGATTGRLTLQWLEVTFFSFFPFLFGPFWWWDKCKLGSSFEVLHGIEKRVGFGGCHMEGQGGEGLV